MSFKEPQKTSWRAEPLGYYKLPEYARNLSSTLAIWINLGFLISPMPVADYFFTPGSPKASCFSQECGLSTGLCNCKLSKALQAAAPSCHFWLACWLFYSVEFYSVKHSLLLTGTMFLPGLSYIVSNCSDVLSSFTSLLQHHFLFTEEG